MASTLLNRKLSLHDRYCLSRHLIGYPPILAFGAILPPSLKTLTTSNVTHAVENLLARHLWLRATVNTDSFPPQWTLASKITADEVVVLTEETLPMDSLLLRGISRGGTLDLTKGPLWRVYLHSSMPSGVQALVLVVHHVAFDGRGASQLFGELLSGLVTSSHEHALGETGVPPIAEETMNMTPSWPHFLKELWKNLVVPRLPVFLQPAPIIVWPNPPAVHPRDAAPCITFFEVSSEKINAAKRIARDHGVRTLHPILQVAALVAINHTFVRSAIPEPPSPLNSLVTETPASIRSAALGHPAIAGNFVASHKHTYSLPLVSTFWDLARTFASDIASPVAKRRALGEVGLLAYLPPSGWEAAFQKRVESATPFRSSVALSNVGLLESTTSLAGLGVQFAWAQAPSVVGAAITLNFMSVKGGPLATTATWREGIFRDVDMKAFQEKFGDTISRISEGEVGEALIMSTM